MCPPQNDRFTILYSFRPRVGYKTQNLLCSFLDLLNYRYELKQGGTGSGVKFIKDGSNEVINFHKPHPSGILKRYVLDQVIEKLRKDGLL